jgi:amidase
VSVDLTMSAAAAAGLVRRGEASARELTEAVLARIAAVNPSLNAVVELRADEALTEADGTDHSGLLGGVPITVKEALPVAGLHSTWGIPDLAGYVAGQDAAAVSRLRAAGAIVVGTTNVALMLGDPAQSANPVYGVTNNPWDLTRTPGGSSGGSAAAVAAGLSFVEYGSDLAGSIRIPASFCGVYGLRPTPGTVPLRGFTPGGTPPMPEHLSYLGTIGPLARTAGDLRLALLATAGPEQPSARSYAWRLAQPGPTALRDFRIGVALDHPLCPVTPEVGAVLSDAVDALAKAGARIVEGWPAGVDPVESGRTFGFQLGLFFAYQQPGPDAPPLTEIIANEHRRLAIRAAWDAYLNDEVDVLLCPTAFTAAFPHDPRPMEERMLEGRPYTDIGFWISFASLAGLPTVAAPVGLTPGGLPVGAQLVAAPYRDDTAITLAELMADVVGGYRIPSTVDISG